jgi:hypothetical protein
MVYLVRLSLGRHLIVVRVGITTQKLQRKRLEDNRQQTTDNSCPSRHVLPSLGVGVPGLLKKEEAGVD